MGHFFEQWKVGEQYETPGRTMKDADIVLFAGLTGDYNQIHTDEEFAAETPFGRPMVHGLYVLAVSHGLIFRLGLFEQTGIAFLGVDEWKFTAPVFAGDTVFVRMTVAETRESRSKPDRGIVKFFVEVLKDRKQEIVVQRGYKTLMFRRQPVLASD